jgi:mRNA interferase MazF
VELKVYPSEAVATVRGRAHKAMADRLTTVSRQRVGARFGRLCVEDMAAVERAIAVQLGLFGPGA